MRIPGLERAAVAGRWLRSRSGPRALILGYHRIAAGGSDPFSLSVAPERFAEQMEALRRHADPVRLEDLAGALEEGAPPPGAVAVTFDDGYASVLEEAKPRLERWRIPATAFLVAGCLGRPLWWDTLERTVLASPSFPPRGSLEVGGSEVTWSLDDGRGRARLLDRLYWRLRRLDDRSRRAALAALAERAGPPPAPLPRTLSPAELDELVRGGLMTIGSHTVTHPDLTDLDPATAWREILDGKASLERLLGRPVRAFSFPFGKVPSGARETLAGAGFAVACTSRADLVRPGGDVLDLPRFWPPNWDGARFGRWLALWLGK